MERKYTMDTLPKPNNPDIRLVQRPERIMAVLRYSGTWSEERYAELEQQLGFDRPLLVFEQQKAESERAMLERAVTLCASGVIQAEDLHMRADGGSNDSPARGVVGDLGDQVEDVQRQAIVEALEKTRYNKTQAAKLLGLTFRQLRYRIKKLGIE